MCLIQWILLLTVIAQVALGSSSTSWNGSISINYNGPNVRVGKVLKMNCTASKEVANTQEFNVKRMFLQADGKKMDGVKILSDVSIGFEENVTFESPAFYSCWYNFTMLADINISYGAPPPEPVVEKFVIHNWEKVELNLGPTQQKIIDTTGNKFYPNITIRYSFLNCSECEKCSDLDITTWRACSNLVNWQLRCTIVANDYIDSGNKAIYFFVRYKNDFGSHCETFHLKKANAIKPHPVEIVSVSVLNSTSIKVELKQTSKCLDMVCLYNITLRATNLEHEISFTESSPSNPFFITKSGLYPHGVYTILVTTRPESGGLSSNVSNEEIVRLWEDVPAANPAFIPGAREYYKEVDGKQDVQVYWQEIPEKNRNGKITSLYLEVHQGSTANGEAKEVEPDQLMAKLSLKSGEDYTITLSAATQNGTNTTLQPSVLQIKGKTDGDLCVVTNVVAVHVQGAQRVNVSWENCDSNQPINQNVLYMCQKKRDEKECVGPLRWRLIPSNMSQVMADLPGNDQYRIGVANIVGNSSRMVWSPCLFQQGAEPSEGPQGRFQQSGPDIEYKLDGYYCRENTGIVQTLNFNVCESKEDGSCKDQQRTLTAPMPAYYLHREATFMVPVERFNKKYLVSVVAKSDGGEKNWGTDTISMQQPQGSDSLHDYMYLMLIPGVLLVILVICLIVKRYYYKVVGKTLSVKVPEVVGKFDYLENQSNEQEPVYDEIESGDNIANTSDANTELIRAVTKEHHLSNSNVSTAETSLSDDVPSAISTSKDDSSGLGTSQSYDTSGSDVSYAKITLTDDREPADDVILNIDNKSSAAAILNLDSNANGGRSVPGYEKLQDVKRVRNLYDKLTPPLGQVLLVLQDNLYIPEHQSKQTASDLCVDKTSKGLVGIDVVKDDLLMSDSCVQSGMDTTSDSDIENGNSDNSGDRNKNVAPTLFDRLMTANDPSSSSSGSNTGHTAESTSQGCSNSNTTPNHLYRSNLQGSADSYDSHSGHWTSSAESNQDYRRAGPEPIDEACGKVFEHMRSDRQKGVDSVDESNESQS
ncbi:uncharacterized protein LOC135497612 isoform X2 [Lineus longissimus]|uniref:uncharacterized protein LOC135497612 isoform X2 n=1 Tax=Lineus longissimus TaxID=88925 RepID=UPI00315DAC24